MNVWVLFFITLLRRALCRKLTTQIQYVKIINSQRATKWILFESLAPRYLSFSLSLFLQTGVPAASYIMCINLVFYNKQANMYI